MGYDVHIKRAKRITRAEWNEIVDGDPDFAGLLSFRDGRISMKTPTDDHLAQLTQLARTLKGRVVGDDGEEYALRPVKKKPKAPKLSKSDASASPSRTSFETQTIRDR